MRIILSGLCAFVPMANGNLTVLLVDARYLDSSHNPPLMEHYPALSLKIKNVNAGGYDDRQFDSVVADSVGDEVGMFVLNDERISLAMNGALTAPSRPKAWFWGAERPWWFIPRHRGDARWAVETKEFMRQPAVNPLSSAPPVGQCCCGGGVGLRGNENLLGG